MSKSYRICVIGGDGIGGEVIAAAVELLGTIGIGFEFERREAGWDCYQKNGTPLPEATVTAAGKSDAVLFGAVTTPPNIKNYFSPIVRLRKLLGLYANVRPFFSLPVDSSREGVDMVIVRENTEDLYAGVEKVTKVGAIAYRIITRKACRDICKFAFAKAHKEKRSKVTAVHKANILRLTDGLFLEEFHNIAKKYPKIEAGEMLVDSCAANLIKKPQEFDVIVTTNMFGDILSDEAAALTGGLGVAASANIGHSHGLFEPVHGSAPKYKGKNVANPTAAFLAASYMLDYLQEGKAAKIVRQAVIKTITGKQITRDLGGVLSASRYTAKVIQEVKRLC